MKFIASTITHYSLSPTVKPGQSYPAGHMYDPSHDSQVKSSIFVGKGIFFPAKLEGCSPVDTSGHLAPTWGESAWEYANTEESRAEEWKERVSGITSFEPLVLAIHKANKPCNFWLCEPIHSILFLNQFKLDLSLPKEVLSNTVCVLLIEQ